VFTWPPLDVALPTISSTTKSMNLFRHFSMLALPLTLVTPRNTWLRLFFPTLLACTCAAASGQPLLLTTDIPPCRVPGGKVLPDKYYKLQGSSKAFAWVPGATAGAWLISGGGWERIDGSELRDWFSFYRIDLNGDGICDWYVNAAAPMSSGGDRETINTLYLGGPQGWTRIGASVPDNKPDQLGFGKTGEQQQFLFGEEPAIIHDRAGKINYLITAFYNRNVQRGGHAGYRIYTWDTSKNTLRWHDKWLPGSKAAEVYAFFKAHGARVAGQPPGAQTDTLQSFDPDLEAFELEQACATPREANAAPQSASEVSAQLLARCRK
jgi:hypothetical protein